MDYPYNRSCFPLSPHEAPNYGVTQSPDGTPDSASWLPPQGPYTTPVPVSYEREADKVASMKRRIEGLKAEIELLASSNDDTSNDAVFGRPRMPERFDAVPDPKMPVFYPFSGFDLDRRLLDPHPDFIVSQLDDRL